MNQSNCVLPLKDACGRPVIISGNCCVLVLPVSASLSSLFVCLNCLTCINSSSRNALCRYNLPTIAMRPYLSLLKGAVCRSGLFPVVYPSGTVWYAVALSKYHSTALMNLPMNSARNVDDFRSPAIGSSTSVFNPQKVLVLSKITRLDYERSANKNLTEDELSRKINQNGSDYERLVSKHNTHYEFLKKICHELSERKVEYKVVMRWEYESQEVDWADAVIAAGGDGTFLWAASKIRERSKPLIGINTDPLSSEGYLCLLKKQPEEQLPIAFEKLFSGNFKWIWRQRIRITLIGDGAFDEPAQLYDCQMRYPEYRWADHMQEHESSRLGTENSVSTVYDNHSDCPNDHVGHHARVLPYLALNDIFIGESLSSRVSYYDLQVDDGPFMKQKSSGLTACTGTGSTSWYFNINRLSDHCLKDLLKIVSDELKVKLPYDDSEIVNRLCDKFNNQLAFPPETVGIAYVVRDPIFNETFLPFPSRGFAKQLLIKSRGFDAQVIIDGGVSYAFNYGTMVKLEVNAQDALQTTADYRYYNTDEHWMSFYKEIWEELLEKVQEAKIAMEHENEDNFTNSYNELAEDIWTLPKPFHRMNNTDYMVDLLNSLQEPRNVILSSCTERPTVALPNANYATEPFGQCYPEELETSLDSGHLALTCRFNRWGTLVVAGCNDGYLVIYDFVTRRMVKKYVTHMHAITAVSWSRDGKYLLSSSFDETIVVSDVVAGETVKKFSMPSIVNDIQMHPVKKDQYLICFLQHMPILMTIDDQRTIIPIETEKNTTEISGIVASFDKSGNRIICGNNKGKVMVYDVDSLSLIASFVVTGNHPIRSLIVAPRGDFFLTNSNDRIIRVFTLSTVLEAGVDGTVLPNQKVQDSVNRTSWKVCRFSGDAEYICAGSSGSHSLYIWERNNGSLVKILQGSKGEQVADLIWHPTRAAAFSISNGKLLLWSQSPTENWSAFAPDFKELDENIEYEERESEFDVEDEDRSIPETESIDEDGMDSLRLILIAPDVENPEETLPDANKDAASKAEPVPAGKKRETAAKMTTPVCRSVRTTETRRRRGGKSGTTAGRRGMAARRRRAPTRSREMAGNRLAAALFPSSPDMDERKEIDRKARKIFIKGSTITSNVSADSDEIVEEKIVEKLVEETQANADIERKLQALDRLKKLNFDFKSKHGINPLATVPLKQNLVHVVEYRSEGDRLFVNEPNCRGLNKDERLDLKTKSRTPTDETSQHERRISSKRTSRFNDDEFQSLQEKRNLHLETSNTSGHIFQQTYFGTSVYPGSHYFDDRQHDHNSTTLHSMIYKAELFGESCESPFISTPPIGFVEAWLPFVPLSFQQGIPNIGPCVELNSQLIPEQRAEMETGQRVADNEVEVTTVLDKEDLAAFRKILHDFRKKKSSQLQKKVSYNCDENTCLNLQLMKDSCLPMAELKSVADVASAQTPKLRCAVTLDKDQSRRLFHSANLLVPDLKIYYSNCEQSYRKKHQRHLFFYGDPTMISMSDGKVVSASKGKALEQLFATLSKKASQLLISVPRYEMSPRYQALCCIKDACGRPVIISGNCCVLVLPVSASLSSLFVCLNCLTCINSSSRNALCRYNLPTIAMRPYLSLLKGAVCRSGLFPVVYPSGTVWYAVALSKYHSTALMNLPMNSARNVDDFRSPAIGSSTSVFNPQKVLVLSKITRLDYERSANKNLTEDELSRKINQNGSDYERLVSKHNTHYEFLKKICHELSERKVEYKVVKRWEYESQEVDWADAVIAAGGDGTFLWAASKIRERSKPLIGINTDPLSSEGYLCLLKKQPEEQLPIAFEKLFSGNFKWIWRQRIRITLIGDGAFDEPAQLYDCQMRYPEYRWADHMQEHESSRLGTENSVSTVYDNHSDCPNDHVGHHARVLPYLALNDIFIGESLSSRVSYYDLQVDDGPFMKQKSSGLTACTGTGSTSWYFNINRLSDHCLKDLLKIVSDELKVKLPYDDSEIVNRLCDKFNNQLAFPPETVGIAYVVRDPIFNETFLPFPSRGFAKQLLIKSRGFDAQVIIDGGVSYAFNYGTMVKLEVNAQDALQTVIFR
ncbi:Retinoblastoma-binding protein 5 [Trichinella sp. T8]|nr:Retinoblastoma-binding protein 5 [Trichinella sp. T8]